MASVVVNGDTSGAVTLTAPAVAGTVTVTLPSTSGTMAVLPTATGVLAESAGGTGTTTGYYGFKNRIINGAMVIDQRNAGASVTNLATATTYTLDRWAYYAAQASKFTLQQNAGSVTPPVGFSNYLGATSLSAYSVGASDTFLLIHKIEGYNVADLAWGTANATAGTLSFRVYSSLTGTFGGSITNGAENRSYPFSYSVSSANTWTTVSITIPGDTSGTWTTTNGSGLQVFFGLGAGSTYSGTAGAWAGAAYYSATGATSVVGTNGATFYITGVQLEKGATATAFDYRDYGCELAMCQRYCLALTSVYTGMGAGIWYSTTGAITTMQFPVAMRATPTLTTSSPNVGYLTPGGTLYSTNPTLNGGSTTNFEFYSVVGAGSSTAGYATVANLYSGKCFITAEL